MTTNTPATTDEAIANVIDKAMVGAEKLAQALQRMVEAYGSDAIDLALNVARIDAFSHLVPGSVCAVVATALFFFFRFAAKKWDEDYASQTGHYKHSSWDVPTIISALLGTVLSVIAVAFLFNIWAWVGIFYPELWIVKKFFL